MKKQKLTRKEVLKRCLVVVSALLIVAAMLLVVHFWEENHSDYEDGSNFELEETLEFEGEEYSLRSDVETLLLIGLDKFGDSAADASYNNDRQADFLLLLIFDKKTEECSAIHINRDTMTDVTVLGLGGKKVGTVKQQVALSHTYGSGANDSARNTASAVSGIFGGLKIDHYLSVTMDAVALINDAVGGVTLTVRDDLTEYDEALEKGKEVTLRSNQALIYVRSRYSVADSSNKARMERQRQYLDALYAKMSQEIQKNEDLFDDVLVELSDHIVSDCTSARLETLFERLGKYENLGLRSIEGTYVENQYVEFYPDATALKKLLIEYFYEPKK